MTTRPWWRDAVIYEVYPRSFADSNGDGDGDLAGLRSHLPYLAGLGIDAIWIAPWYPSPMADGGYDVSDYCDIHPMFGTLADADGVLHDAHALGIRVIIDLVANHTSEHHPWFCSALRAAPGSPERDRYFFRDGRGAEGKVPPNNWISAFGGSTWTRVTEPGGSRGQWYLHTFAPEQPDLNWQNADVVDDFDDVLRFWFDRGVDGMRIDAAPALAKSADLRDADYGDHPMFVAAEWQDNPHWDVEEVHHILRRWRRIGDSYDGDRVFIAEAVVNGPERLSRYLRPDEMHTAFNFQFLKASWDPGLRAVIDSTLAALAIVQAPATWVLSSHDETRLVTRYGRQQTGARHFADDQGTKSDVALGLRRARAALMLMLALPGGTYIYQGDELGLPEVESLPEDLLQDPIWERSGRTVRGRDGSRVPLPWRGETSPFGFSEPGVRTWLPQPEEWRALIVEAQSDDPQSTLALHRTALRLRRKLPDLRADDFAWRSNGDGVLDFQRGHRLRCVVNFGPDDTTLDHGWDLLLSSSPIEGRALPPDAAAWMLAVSDRLE